MINGLRRRVSRQLGRPTGGFGRLLARGLNRFNREINAEAVVALEVDAAQLDGGPQGGPTQDD